MSVNDFQVGLGEFIFAVFFLLLLLLRMGGEVLFTVTVFFLGRLLLLRLIPRFFLCHFLLLLLLSRLREPPHRVLLGGRAWIHILLTSAKIFLMDTYLFN